MSAPDIARRLREADWQPIETAPKNRGRLLLTNGADVVVGEPKLFGAAWEYWRIEAGGLGHDCPPHTHTWSIVPTHWMPLPAVASAIDVRTEAAAALEAQQAEIERLRAALIDCLSVLRPLSSPHVAEIVSAGNAAIIKAALAGAGEAP